MKRFNEFVSERDGVVNDPSTHQLDQAELLQRIIRTHGGRFRTLLHKIIKHGDVDDDPELLSDIKELAKAISNKSTYDQHPIRDKQKHDREPDIVSRPKADGGGPSDGGGNSGGGGGGE